MTLIQEIIKSYLGAFFSAFGVFTLTFMAMYWHYRVRKSVYNNFLPYYKKRIGEFKIKLDNNKEKMGFLLNKLGAKNDLDFFYKIYNNKIKLDSFIEGMAKDIFKDINNLERDIAEEEKSINYIENYSFKRYIVDILDKRFPAAHLSRREE